MLCFYFSIKRNLLVVTLLAIVSLHLCHAQFRVCGSRLGRPLDKTRCETAFANLPEGNLPSIFTTRQRSETNNFIQLPQTYLDHPTSPACLITVELDGHSQNDVFVMVPWNQIRLLTASVIEHCVGTFRKGGVVTYGLNRTFEALIPLTPYDARVNPVRGRPAGVVNPDGTAGSTVAMPAGYEDGINVPLYMKITVYGAYVVVEQSKNVDYEIGEALSEYLFDEARSSTTTQRFRHIVNTFRAIDDDYFHQLNSEDPSRWWELLSPKPNAPPDATPKVTCTATYGTPSIANCASLFFQLLHSGPVVLDPGAGPLNRLSGNCAIGIEASSRVSTTWAAIRDAVEALLETCMRSPVRGVMGGVAIGDAVGRKGRRGVGEAGFTVSMYLQEPFNGAPEDTCAWAVVSEHRGDVRQCPAPRGVWRPPERRLGANETGGNWTMVGRGF